MSSPTFTLYCNYSKCFNEIKNKAWVTSCSHIFCENHGRALKKTKAINCPTCNKHLNNPNSLYETKLNPDKDYKKVILMGMEPVAVFEVAFNAINFWIHQKNAQNHIMLKKLINNKVKLNKVENMCHEQSQKIKELKMKVERELDINRRLTFEIENLRLKNGLQVNSINPRPFDDESSFNFV